MRPELVRNRTDNRFFIQKEPTTSVNTNTQNKEQIRGDPTRCKSGILKTVQLIH